MSDNSSKPGSDSHLAYIRSIESQLPVEQAGANPYEVKTVAYLPASAHRTYMRKADGSGFRKRYVTLDDKASVEANALGHYGKPALPQYAAGDSPEQQVVREREAEAAAQDILKTLDAKMAAEKAARVAAARAQALKAVDDRFGAR